MAEGTNRLLAIAVTTGIFVGFAIVDIATPQVMPWHSHDGSRWLSFLSLGVCIAQLTLIASWAVFAPGNIVVRFPWTLLLGLMMWYVLVFGEHSAREVWNPQNSDDVIILGEILLLTVTVLQIPLWIAKTAFRVRISRAEEDRTKTTPERFQFNLRDLLIGTFLFAVALSPIRYMLPKKPINSLWPDSELLLLIPVAIVADLLATLPCLWIGFRRRVLALIAFWAGYELIVAGIEHVVLHAYDHAPWEIKLYGWLAVLNLSQAAVVFAVARTYYALGYRLQRVPRHAPPPPDVAELQHAAETQSPQDSTDVIDGGDAPLPIAGGGLRSGAQTRRCPDGAIGAGAGNPKRQRRLQSPARHGLWDVVVRNARRGSTQIPFAMPPARDNTWLACKDAWLECDEVLRVTWRFLRHVRPASTNVRATRRRASIRSWASAKKKKKTTREPPTCGCRLPICGRPCGSGWAHAS